VLSQAMTYNPRGWTWTDGTKMKYIGIIFCLLLLLAAGCTPAPPNPVPASPSATDAVPSPSRVPATTSPPVITPPAAPEQSPAPTPASEPTPTPVPKPESKDIGIQFVWTVDSGIRLEDASVPNILRLEDGKFRLYYGGPGGILSAISRDGLNFTKEAGVRVSSGSAGSAEMIVSDPTLVKLKDGRVP